MALDVLSNYVEATVTTGGTTAPAAGTVETWTVTTTQNWPVLASGQQIRVMDKAQLGSTSGYEIMLVSANANGTGVSWTATRGVEGTTPVAHAANWTAVPATTAVSLMNSQDYHHTPQDYGFQVWSDPVSQINGYSTLPFSGEAFGRQVRIMSPLTISTVVIWILESVSTLTTGENFLGVYNASGNLLGSTGDMTSAIEAGGIIEGTLTSPVDLAEGYAFLAVVMNGTGLPNMSFVRTQNYSANSNTFPRATIQEFVGTGSTSDTTLPSTGISALQKPYPMPWMAAY